MSSPLAGTLRARGARGCVSAPGVRVVGSRGANTFRAGRFLPLNLLSWSRGPLFGRHVLDGSAGRPVSGPLRRPAVWMRYAAGRTRVPVYAPYGREHIQKLQLPAITAIFVR